MNGKIEKDIKEDLIKEIISLAAHHDWSDLTLDNIAMYLKIDLARLQEHFKDKTDILTAFGSMIDYQVLDNVDAIDLDILPRDRLFDILMERYETLGEYRDGIISILNSFKCDPKQIVIFMPHLCHSISRMIDAAGMETNGIIGTCKVTVITGIYVNVLIRTWKDDTSADLGKTMAALDKNIIRVEKLANLAGF